MKFEHLLLTDYAAAQIMNEHSRQDLYQTRKEEDSRLCWRTPETADDVSRIHTVTVTGDSMKCTCQYPTYWLLPCRHVLAVNVAAGFGSAFVADQCGRRWHRNFQRSQRTVQAGERAGGSVTAASSDSDCPMPVQLVVPAQASKAALRSEYMNIINQTFDSATHSQYKLLIATMESIQQMIGEPAVLQVAEEYLRALVGNTVAAKDPVVTTRRGKRRIRSNGEANNPASKKAAIGHK